MADIKEDSEPLSEGPSRTISAAEEIIRKQARELDKFKTPLKPSDEVQLFLDRETNILSGKAKKLLQPQAYFYERSADTLIESYKNERPEVLLDEDAEEINKALEWLELDWSDYLDPVEELQAGKDVIKSLKDTVAIMRDSNQPAFITWFNLAKRITEFQTNIISNEAKDSVEQQRIILINNNLQNYILNRVPILLNKPPFKSQVQTPYHQKLGKIRKGIEIGESQEDVENNFDDLDEYMEEHYVHEALNLNISRSQGLKWRNVLITLIDKKGTAEGTLTGNGKRIVLEGTEIQNQFSTDKIEIWHPRGEYPVHITAVGIGQGDKPHYIRIDKNGAVESSVSYYDDDVESIRRSEETQKISQERWEKFIETVIVHAESYNPN